MTSGSVLTRPPLPLPNNPAASAAKIAGGERGARGSWLPTLQRLALCLGVLSCVATNAARADDGRPAAPSGTAFSSDDGNPYWVRYHQALVDISASDPGAEAIGPLLELVGLYDSLPDRPVIDAVAEVARTAFEPRRGDPLVGAWAAFHLARWEDERGRTDEARRLRERLGLIEDFWVLGPFEAQGRSTLESPLAPEREPLSVLATVPFEGKFQSVSWRKVRSMSRAGVVLVGAAVAPDDQAAAFLAVYVRSARKQAAALRLGSSGPVKAWLNGRAVLTREVERPARLDQDAAPVQLERGENLLVLKTVNLDGAWRLLVRLTDPQGLPLSGVTATLEGKRSAPLGPAGPATRTVRDLGPELEARWTRALAAGKTEKARQLALSLARFWAHASPFDQEEKPGERVLRATLEKGDAFALWRLLGEIAAEDNDRLAALEKALSLDPPAVERCLVLCELGDLAQAARRPVRALSLRQQAIATEDAAGSGRCWPAHLALAEEARAAGMPAWAWQRLEALPAALEELPPVQKRQIQVALALGQVERARGTAAALAKRRQTDSDLADTLLDGARAARDTDTLLRLTESLAKRRPDLSFWTQDWAEALEGAGRLDEATRVLSDAVEAVPGAADLHEALGRLHARRGRSSEAVRAMEQALSLRPQNPTLRKYRESLTRDDDGRADEAAADLARRYALDPTALVSEALAPPLPAAPEDAARVLLDRRVVNVHENGLSEVFAQRLVHVLTEPGARQNETFYIRYTPGSQEVEVRQARVYRRNPSGVLEISSATGREDRDLSEPWYSLYYDNRAEVVTFEGLHPGDVLEIQYTVADVAARNEMSGYFGDFQFVAETVPTNLWQYVLVGPSRKTFFFHTPTLPGFSRDQVERGGRREYRFEARPVAKVIPEPSMPGWAEVAPYLHVSTYETWDQVGRWYWNLVAEQLVPDANVKRLAETAVAGAKTLEDKVRAVHEAVIRGTRYVGLEFGIHGYKPYRVSQILSRRFGDCKDKASLMVSMLKVVGVEAELVLLRTRRGGAVEAAPASLAVFDHAIVYVPALDLYLDGTAEFSGMKELPHQDQGTMALRVSSTGQTLVQTPVLPSRDNQARRTWSVALGADGAAKVEETVMVRGQAAPEWRQHYQTAGERLDKYGKIWNARFPGAVVSALAITGTEAPSEPVAVSATIDVPHLAVAQGPALLLPLASRTPEYLRAYARLSHRRMDLVLSYPWQHEETLVFDLPPGFEVARLPKDLEIEAPFGRFRLAIVRDAELGSRLTVESRLDMVEYRFSSAQYGAFRQFLGAAEAALRDHVRLEPVQRPTVGVSGQ